MVWYHGGGERALLLGLSASLFSSFSSLLAWLSWCLHDLIITFYLIDALNRVLLFLMLIAGFNSTAALLYHALGDSIQS